MLAKNSASITSHSTGRPRLLAPGAQHTRPWQTPAKLPAGKHNRARSTVVVRPVHDLLDQGPCPPTLIGYSQSSSLRPPPPCLPPRALNPPHLTKVTVNLKQAPYHPKQAPQQLHHRQFKPLL
jgi:hypothetical protein